MEVEQRESIAAHKMWPCLEEALQIRVKQGCLMHLKVLLLMALHCTFQGVALLLETSLFRIGDLLFDGRHRFPRGITPQTAVRSTRGKALAQS